jgi:hypothetical protein
MVIAMRVFCSAGFTAHGNTFNLIPTGSSKRGNLAHSLNSNLKMSRVNG